MRKCPLCLTDRHMVRRSKDYLCTKCASFWNLSDLEDERRSGGEYKPDDMPDPNGPGQGEGSEYEQHDHNDDGDGRCQECGGEEGDPQHQGEGDGENEGDGKSEQKPGEGGHGDSDDAAEDNVCDLLAQALTGTGMVAIDPSDVGRALRTAIAEGYAAYRTCTCDDCCERRAQQRTKADNYQYVEPKQPSPAGEVLALMEKVDVMGSHYGGYVAGSLAQTWMVTGKQVLARFTNDDHKRIMATKQGILPAVEEF